MFHSFRIRPKSLEMWISPTCACVKIISFILINRLIAGKSHRWATFKFVTVQGDIHIYTQVLHSLFRDGSGNLFPCVPNFRTLPRTKTCITGKALI